MTSISHVQTAVEQLITDTCTTLPSAARQRLAFFILGIMRSGSVVLRRVATTHVWPSSTSAPGHERRLRRILHDPQLTWAHTSARSLRRILTRPRTGGWQVIIDETGHTDRRRVLVAALWYRGRAMPLAWLRWPAQMPQTESSWNRCQTLLTLVAEVLPTGVPVTLKIPLTYAHAAPRCAFRVVLR